eukprot:8050709-Alexandrium_andersonii.AAC.1
MCIRDSPEHCSSSCIQLPTVVATLSIFLRFLSGVSLAVATAAAEGAGAELQGGRGQRPPQ